MKNSKKIVSLALSSILVIGSVSAFAANGDVWTKDGKELFKTAKEIQSIEKSRKQILVGEHLYLLEQDGKLYDYADANAAFDKVGKDSSKLAAELAKAEYVPVGEAQKQKCETLLYKLAA